MADLPVSNKDMHAALESYSFDRNDSAALPRSGFQPQSSELQTYLDRLFSPKQKDLVFKKLRQAPLTKTEREYYSGVVRKKLVAIANHEIFEIATKLTQKKR